MGVRERARVFVPRGSAPMLAVDALGAFGFGASFPFITMYLTLTRGLDLAVAGAATAALVLAALPGGLVGGGLADRLGPRAAVCGGLVAAVLGTAALVVVVDPVVVVLALVLSGFGAAVAGPATDAALARSVAAADRASAFSVKHVTHNVGMGVGSVAGALVVVPGDSSSYVLPFGLEVAALVAGLAVASRLPSTRSPSDGRPDGRRTRYRDLLGDRELRRVLAVALGLFAAGFGASAIAIPAHMAVGLDLDPRLLGIWFTVNTATVIVAQLFVLRAVRGRRRGRVLAVMGLLWAGAWLLVLLAGAVTASAAVALVLVSAAVFGLGETLFPPTLPVLVNAIAPADAVGRYNGAFSFTTAIGNATAMAVSGVLLGQGLSTALFASCAVVCLWCALTSYRFRTAADTID